MTDAIPSDALRIAALLLGAIGVALVLLFWFNGRKLAGPHVFRASRFSRGNLLFPTQVSVTPASEMPVETPLL